MIRYLCPFCMSDFPSISRLNLHLMSEHRDRPLADRDAALKSARPVEDVEVTASALVAEANRDATLAELMPPVPKLKRPEVPCVCGLPLVPLDDSIDYPLWMHETPTPKCRSAIPAAGMPTRKDRDNTLKLIAEMNIRMRAAGKDMAGIKAKLDEAQAAFDRMDSYATRPDVIRRTVLSEVLDKLLDTGHVAAYVVVSDMLRSSL